MITVFRGQQVKPTKINDISSLKLPQLWHRKIEKIVYDNRMEYEVYMESAEGYNALRKSLTSRNYKNVPNMSNPLLNIASNEKPEPQLKSVVNRPTMTRKKK